MKKVLLLTMLVICSTVAHSQEVTYYGAKQGGFAISFDAKPLLNYVGNIFNGSQNNSIGNLGGLKNNNFSGTTITGKYMLKDNLSIDLGVGFNNVYNTTNHYDSDDSKIGSSIDASTAFLLKVGSNFLLYPGRRLQPVLGAGIDYARKNEYTKEKYKSDDGNAYSGSPVHVLSLYANTGIECFLTESVSLGVTIDFGIAKEWHITKEKNEDDSVRMLKEGKSIIKTCNNGGNIFVIFYF